MASASSRVLEYEGAAAVTRPQVWPLFVSEAAAAIGSNLLMVGIFFYTQRYFGWGSFENLLLAAAQGVVYIVGALLASRISQRFNPRRTLIVVYASLGVLSLAAALVHSPTALVAVLLTYVFCSALNWPVLEGAVCSGLDAHQLSRRVGTYNLVWSGCGAVMVAVSGSIIAYLPLGLFLVPMVVHLAAAGAMSLWRPPVAAPLATAHVAPEPLLARQRKLALWLSRIALPSTFVVIYSLMAMMPSLPVMQPLDTAAKTALGSVWLVMRWVTFLFLGASVWWHTRPRLLLLCAIGMLVAFLGATIRPSIFLSGLGQGGDIGSMVFWQVMLGLCMGIIYTGSLYFGMVLSDGSAEHGGYHEALIGLGSVLGPGAAVAAQVIYPANSTNAGIAAVTLVLLASVAAAVVADRKAGS